MGAFLQLINPIAGILDKIIPDKNAAAQAKAALAQMMAQGQLNAEAQELQSSGDIIKAEANSQSWLPRNVRPLLLLLWGLLITFNEVIPMIARLWYPNLQPMQLDPWVFKLTAIGFTGYVTARTWEKVTNSDN